MVWETTSRRETALITKQSRIEEALEQFRHDLPEPPPHLPAEMREILTVVHRHLFDSQLNVNEVRRRCHLGNHNITTRFRCIVGQGLRDYIETRRMEAAKQLLLDRDLEIYLIAMAIGYEHQETFCRAFQRQIGPPPSRWRRAAL